MMVIGEIHMYSVRCVPQIRYYTIITEKPTNDV